MGVKYAYFNFAYMGHSALLRLAYRFGSEKMLPGNSCNSGGHFLNSKLKTEILKIGDF
jgi:hypothetical protein